MARHGACALRFNAEVVEITQVPDETQRLSKGQTVLRELRPGDRVQKGQVLAVVWSIDVGARKSDLVDALVQLRLDEKRLEEREKLYAQGSLPLDTLLQTRHDVVSDRNAKERAERTLRTWNIPEQEIAAVYGEAERRPATVRRRKKRTALGSLRVRFAPRDGTIVERNVSVGEYVADNTINLFTIAEVDRLLVIANPPEDQLPALLALRPEQMHWTLQTVQTAGDPPIEGPIEDVGYLIDPNQHTAVVKGFIGNPAGTLRAGQFVSATVNLPPPPDVVEVPLTALAEDGKQSFVFVQPDPAQPRIPCGGFGSRTVSRRRPSSAAAWRPPSRNLRPRKRPRAFNLARRSSPVSALSLRAFWNCGPLSTIWNPRPTRTSRRPPVFGKAYLASQGSVVRTWHGLRFFSPRPSTGGSFRGPRTHSLVPQ